MAVTGALLPTLDSQLAASLANWSNVALYSAMVVLTIAMVIFAGYLAAIGSDRDGVAARAEGSGDAAGALPSASQGELVGAAAHAPAASATTSTGSGRHDSAAPPSSGGVVSGPEGPAEGARARKLAASALSLSWLGGLFLVAAVAARGLAVLRPPWGNMFEFAVAGCAVATLGYCLLARRRRWEWLGLFVIGPVVLTLGLALMAFYTEAAELQPALRSIWLLIHVVVAFLAVGVWVIGFSLGVLYLVRARREERGVSKRTFVEALPPAAALERAAYGLNMVGFILWTFTLVAGAIWAQKAWGSYWTWDPKEVWTFVVWVGYAAYMHARATAGWEPRRATVIALVAFGCVIINFTVVNLLFVGQHSYAGG